VTANGIRLAQQTGVALVYGSLYSLSLKQSSIQDRVGLLSMVAIGNFVQPLSSAIRTFPREKSIVMSERSKNMYSVMPYFTAKVLSELPLNLFNSMVFGSLLYPLVGLQGTIRKFRNFLSIGAMHSLTSQSLGMLIR
jgi:ABC-type multidrug transport system permease subunit